MKRILVGVDGSKESRAAAKLAEEIARATGSQLFVASSVAPVMVTESAPELVAQAASWQAKEREIAQRNVKEVAAEIGPGVAVETIVTDGPAATALAELARSGDIELVVVGHRGRNAVARALLGSVADRLVQVSPKPVLVVR